MTELRIILDKDPVKAIGEFLDMKLGELPPALQSFIRHDWGYALDSMTVNDMLNDFDYAVDKGIFLMDVIEAIRRMK